MKFGFIGCGKMASALVQGMLHARVCPATDITAYDIHPAASQALAEKSAITIAADNNATADAAGTIVLCVKPQDALQTLHDMAPALAGKLLISIAAGISIDQLQQATEESARIIRVMPNTPALVGKGAAAYAVSSAVTADDLQTVDTLLSSVGIGFKVTETQLDIVTGLSGSGPAYLYLVMEALSDGAVRMGLPRDLALQLAAQTTAGAAAMVLQTGLHPGQLKDMVTSPGGTTIAGLAALEANGTRSAFIESVEAATQRSRELGNGGPKKF